MRTFHNHPTPPRIKVRVGGCALRILTALHDTQMPNLIPVKLNAKTTVWAATMRVSHDNNR